jgi:hypothetical protein
MPHPRQRASQRATERLRYGYASRLSAKLAAAALVFDLPRTGTRQPWNKAPFRMFTQAPSLPDPIVQ